MAGIGNLIKYLKHMDRRDYLPKLMNTYTRKYSHLEIEDQETELVMMTGLVKGPDEVKTLLGIYGVKTAAELLPLLPRPRPDWKGRLYRWFIWCLGQYESNPHQADFENLKTGKYKSELPQMADRG